MPRALCCGLEWMFLWSAELGSASCRQLGGRRWGGSGRGQLGHRTMAHACNLHPCSHDLSEGKKWSLETERLTSHTCSLKTGIILDVFLPPTDHVSSVNL